MTKRIPALLLVFCAISLRAGDLDTIGVTVLRQVDPTLTGTGVPVAQPEAYYDRGTNWEVTPGLIEQPASLFTYISADGSTTDYPNSLSSDSAHADMVAYYFYGIPCGVATNILHVDNYDAEFFVQEDMIINTCWTNHTVKCWTNYVFWLVSSNLNDPVVNESFIFDAPGTNVQEAIDSAYDDYAAQYNTLFVNGAGNGGPVNPPATCYNGLGVGAYGGSSSLGPTPDNGRCKPDITAPSWETSFSTPYVAGSAVVLIQAANRGDGGPNTNAAADIRTIKALLLNGAIKPNGWTNGTSTPLDARYGAGVVNVFNSWEQMKGGQNAFIESASVSSGAPHPPGSITNNEPVLAGWDTNSLATPTNQDTVNHYYFNLPGNGPFTLTATLVWNKQYGAGAINHLAMFLYATAGGNLVTCSTSLVDNVQHIFLPALPAGRYDLQVMKAGSAGQVSASETYALAFEIFNLPLKVGWTNGQQVISWPVAPAGFQLQSAASLTPPVSWTAVTNAVSVTTNQNAVTLSPGNSGQFFRLARPSF